ncbi:hypothetical protein ACQSNA_000386 [Vibrio metschnikovii]
MKLKSYLALTTIATTSSIVIVVTCAIFFCYKIPTLKGLKLAV